MAYGVINAEQLTTQSGYTLGAGNASSFKNRILNGSMVIDQRNAGASVTPTSGSYTLDRYRVFMSQASKFTVQQTPSAAEAGFAGRISAGFNSYLACTSSSAYAILAGDYFTIRQRIEGFNFADMEWGTSSAKTVTLSFLAYSSLTGTFGGVLSNSAGDRSYPFSYTISTANTWTQISVTIAGDTTGTWIGATNGVGVQVIFSLGAGATYLGTANAWAGAEYYGVTGQTNIVATNGATFYITGVQLEVGTVATSFDYRSYGTELALCQRYYYRISGTGTAPFTAGGSLSTTSTRIQGGFPVSLRIAPTALEQTGTSGNYQLILAGAAVALGSVPVFDDASPYTFSVSVAYTATGSAGQSAWLRCNSTAAYLGWSAEL